MKGRLLLNSLSGTTLFFINAVVVLIMSPVLVRELGNHDYGVWDILLSLCGYMGIFDLGISPAIMRFIARESVQQPSANLHRIASSAFLSLLATGLACLAVMVVFAIAPQRVLNVSTQDTLHLQLLFILFGINLLIQFPGTIFVAYLMGTQKHYLVYSVRMVSTISQAFLVYIALTQWSGSGLIWLSCIVLFGTLTEYSVFCFYVFFCEGILQIRRGYFSWSMLKELYVFGFNSTLLMAADRIQRQSSPLIVSHILGVSQVVFFSIPRRLVDYGKDLGLALGYPLMPFFSSIESRGDADAMREEWFVASRWLQLATLALPIGLLGMGERFLGLWMGPDYAIQGRWVIVFLSLALFIEGLTPNAGRMLVASGKHARPARILLVLSVLSIGVSIVFAKWYRIPGLAFAVMWANAVGSGIQWFLVSPLIRVGLWEHVRRTVGPLMAPMALMATAIWLLAQCLPSHHMAWLCAQGAVSGILYMVAAWFFVANASEKLRVKVWLREKVFHASSKKEISAA